MYTNFYVYTAYRQYMSGKLYWRLKKDGKWTWTPALVVDHVYIEGHQRYAKLALCLEEEE